MPNTCQDTADINSLYLTENAKNTLIIEYSPYKNWGRWNHNPSRIQNVIDLLKESKYNVQLKHIEIEDLNTEGDIKVINEEKKNVYLYPKFQSNSNKNIEIQEKTLAMIKENLV